MDKPRHPQVVRPWKTRQIVIGKALALPGRAVRTRRTLARNPKHG